MHQAVSRLLSEKKRKLPANAVRVNGTQMGFMVSPVGLMLSFAAVTVGLNWL